MGTLNSSRLLFLCSLLIEVISSQENVTPSEPICVTEEPTSGQCSTNVWENVSNCPYSYSKDNLPKCPSGFQTDNDNICYMLTEPTKFPPKCPFENVLSFDYYKDLISTNGVPIWMPITRTRGHYDLGFLEWIEASSMYGKEFDGVYYVKGSLLEANCLLYYNSSYIETVSCNEEHVGVCAYYQLNSDSYETYFCVEDNSNYLCKQSDFGPKSKCFCVGDSNLNQTSYTKAEFLLAYQNYIYDSLTSDNCSIALEKQNSTYIWTDVGKEIDYCYWSPDIIFDSLKNYGAITPYGWILTKEPLTCFLYQKEATILEPSLNLTYDTTKEVLHLEITNPESLKDLRSGNLVYCFTNAGHLSLKYRYDDIYPVENKTGLITYEFEPHKYGPGDYWCEGFKYTDVQPLQTERVFVNQTARYGNEFIAILKLKYLQGTNPLSGSIIDTLERIFFIKLKDHEILNTTYTARIMKILDLDEENCQIWLNVHFTCIVPHSGEDCLVMAEEEEFEEIKTMISAVLVELQNEGFKAEMVSFSSATFCPGNTSYLTWPLTEIGNEAHPKEYCFGANGKRLQRVCGGNFLDGARWYPEEYCDKHLRLCHGNFLDDAQWTSIENCTFPDHSTVTEDLLDLQDEPDALSQIRPILARIHEFDSFDVYLVAKICDDNIEDMDGPMLTQILDNILELNQSVLTGAQKRMRAMDMILDVIDRMHFSVNVSSEDFVAVPLNLDDSEGVILLKNGEVMIINGADDVAATNDFEVAVELITNSSKQTKAVFKIFRNSALFGSGVRFHTVIGVSTDKPLEPDDLDCSSIRVTYKVTSEDHIGESCVFWDLRGSGNWTVNGSIVSNDSTFLYCYFPLHLASAVTALMNSPTQDLEELLNSDRDFSDIINDLSRVTDRFSEFTSDDVYLVGEILEKVSHDDTINLEGLAYIISNLHEINRQILSSSQRKKWATDTILHSVDTILQNHKYEKEVNISTKNFMIFISNLEEIDFSGLIMYVDDDTLQTEILEGEVDVSEILQQDNVTSVLLLSSDLKQQLEHNATIIVTIFSSDSLFNEDIIETTVVNTVFGVILPDIDEYLGPILVIHKLTSSSKYEERCVHWFYNKTQNVTGLWKKDNNSEDLSLFSQCQFWHTTHFALLLLDNLLYDSEILGWITRINCGLSMFGLLFIILTAILFERWRTNSGNQILLNFVFAVLFQINIFYVSNSIDKSPDDYFLCTVIGVALHYSIISQFCWMFIIAILQFKRYVEVLTGPPKHVLLKGCLCGWVLPCLPVACVYFIDNDNYVNGHVGLCYPSELGLYLGVWLPICIVVFINTIIFIYIIYNVVHRKTECGDVGSCEVMFQWRLAILLFFMLGLTWSFGFLSELDFGELFVYLFCFTATLQGFVMFLFFIVFNSNTRYLYSHAIKKCCSKNY